MRTASRLVLCLIAGSAVVSAVNLLPAAAGPESDTVKVQGGVADFGAGGNVGGSPTENGTLTWSSTAQTVTAKLAGLVYRNDATVGACARVTLSLLDLGGLVVASSTSAPACFGAVPGPVEPVDLTVQHPSAFRAVVETFQSPAARGPYTSAGVAHRDLGDLDGSPGPY